MTVLFCDMKGSTALGEFTTPAGLVDDHQPLPRDDVDAGAPAMTGSSTSISATASWPSGGRRSSPPRPRRARLPGGAGPAGGAAGAGCGTARAGGRPARPAAGRDPGRHRHRRGAGRQHRLGHGKSYTVMGGAVNLASRLKASNKALRHQHPGQRRHRAAGGGAVELREIELATSPA